MMKKLISIFTAALTALVITAIPASAWSAGINDMAGLYSDAEIEHLEARQEEVAELTGWNIAVVTTDVGFGLDGVDACDYAEQYCYDTFGSDPDSVVYLIDLDYRWISMDGDLLNYFNSSRFDTMMDTCEDCYQDYKDVENLEIFYHYLEYFYNEGTVEYDPTIGALGDDFEDAIVWDDDKTIDLTMIFGGFIAGLIGAAISVGIVLARYKTHHAPSANSYLNRSSVNMYNNQDYFVREYTTRTRIESSSSGGSHRSGGSRRSGGRSRGGGGRGGRR